MKAVLILFIVAMALSAIGWKKFIYFISLGYGFSIAGCAIAIAVIFWHTLTLPAALLCVTLFVYGCRLGGYLLIRELKSASYRNDIMKKVKNDGYPIGVVIAIWVSCAILYVAEVSPVAFRLMNMQNGIEMSSTWAWIGVAVMAIGIIMETIADAQKAKAKKINPKRFVDTGLFRIVRCPNYFGEMITWTGCFLVCVGASCTIWQWIIASLGYAGIVYIMFSGARRLELSQNQKYGNDKDYQEYVKKTPILIPLLPIYTVARHKWLRG